MVTLLNPVKRWYCPNCTVTDETPALTPNRFHTCVGLRGLQAPLVPSGQKAWVEAVDREDYVKGEAVQTDADGRPVMAIVTRRPDGSNDTAVLVPGAVARGEAN